MITHHLYQISSQSSSCLFSPGLRGCSKKWAMQICYWGTAFAKRINWKATNITFSLKRKPFGGSLSFVKILCLRTKLDATTGLALLRPKHRIAKRRAAILAWSAFPQNSLHAFERRESSSGGCRRAMSHGWRTSDIVPRPFGSDRRISNKRVQNCIQRGDEVTKLGTAQQTCHFLRFFVVLLCLFVCLFVFDLFNFFHWHSLLPYYPSITGTCGPPEKLSLTLVPHSHVLRMLMKLAHYCWCNLLTSYGACSTKTKGSGIAYAERVRPDVRRHLWKGPVLIVHK